MHLLLRLLTATAAIAALSFQSLAQEPLAVGWLEKVRVYPGGIEIAAKLDTGADATSLHALPILHFKSDGQDWVAFDLLGATGEAVRVERRVVRNARIKRAGAVQSRPVIRLAICLGPIYREVEVNLVDRSGMNLPMLIGRNFMMHRVVIDPGLKFTVDPDCKEATRP